MFLILLWTGYCLDRMTTSFGLVQGHLQPADLKMVDLKMALD